MTLARNSTRVIIVAAASVLVGLTGHTVAAEPGSSERPSTSCALEVMQPGDTRFERRPVFSVSRTLDLVLRTSFPADFRDVRMLELHVTTPRGHLYQALAVPVAEPGQASVEGRVLPDYPYPVKERLLLTVVDSTGVARKVVDTPFPVGGTAIVENGLYGRWSVQVYLNHATRVPCATAWFELTP
ncbi:MAG TPA: hypothetical protein PLP31_13465 [Thermoanaerobaculaceae bacterium]|nr:hypothetical protein [Thermoanaerobaculaceae bacterium]